MNVHSFAGMRRFPPYTSLVPLALAGLLASCAKEAPPPPQMPPPEVSVVTVTAQSVTLTRELAGRVNAMQVAEVRPQATGIVMERLFEEGGEVKAGQALYQLDDTTYQASQRSAEANLARAQAALELAELNAERTAGLFEANAVSRQEQDNAASALSLAQADLAVAQAAVANSATLLGYTRIEAPISGRIGKSSVTQGALVTANQEQALATIHQLDPIYVDVTQSSAELLRLQQSIASGALQRATVPVAIELEGGALYDREGELAFSEMAVDPATGRVTARVVVENPDHLLLPGMYVRAKIGLGTRQGAVLVPQQAVNRGPSGNTSVMLVNSEGAVELRDVELGQTIGNQWLVESGLAAGERVITEGLQKAQPGMTVRIAAADSEPATR